MPQAILLQTQNAFLPEPQVRFKFPTQGPSTVHVRTYKQHSAHSQYQRLVTGYMNTVSCLGCTLLVTRVLVGATCLDPWGTRSRTLIRLLHMGQTSSKTTTAVNLDVQPLYQCSFTTHSAMRLYKIETPDIPFQASCMHTR